MSRELVCEKASEYAGKFYDAVQGDKPTAINWKSLLTKIMPIVFEVIQKLLEDEPTAKQ